MSEYVLEMTGIVKEFPGVRALKNVELRVRPGTVHALLGENGAGKSTLMKCLIGIYQKNAGKILFKGKEINFPNTHTALNSGISMIHQELSPVPARKVSQNVWMGREPRKWGIFIDHKKMRSDTLALFERLDLKLDPDAIMGTLTVAQMQMVEIAKAVSYNSDIVIMDEPTSSLTDKEVGQLFRIIRQLKEQNVAIIYISHKMDEIYQICDEITTFRDGEYIATDLISDITIQELIKKMVGRELDEMFPKVDCPIGETVLKVENLSAGNVIKDVSFELRRGEILGFAGLVGAGRTELMEAIFGMRRKTGGRVFKDGKEIQVNSPQDALKNRIVLLTEDRRALGIIGVRSISDNVILSDLKRYGFPLKHKKIREDSANYVAQLAIKTPSIYQLVMNLSGGNQQKVLVSRLLLTNPDILIVDEPTRGIDVGAKSEIHSLITKLAGQGKAIILISSELPEVMGMSDRINVMYEGKLVGSLERSEFAQESIMQYAMGQGQ